MKKKLLSIGIILVITIFIVSCQNKEVSADIPKGFTVISNEEVPGNDDRILIVKENSTGKSFIIYKYVGRAVTMQPLD